MYNSLKQQELADKFEAGDVESSVCHKCFEYFKQPLYPREKCYGCFTNQTEFQKASHHKEARRYRYLKTSNNLPELEVIRYERLKEIRSKVKVIPKVLRVVGKVDPSKFERFCLKCGKRFMADSKFQRLCDQDRATAANTGMNEYTHYYVGEAI
ncbi:MAG: hypothetical protein Unbinned1322contig1000_23 [Prokaryotic dsDNA virus sp.]|mgnify:CR=1 FL=1|nr:hypothetical protein [Aequorivita sp.]QDP57279.1 MAG: hypothetical protein Unbinned1322contig1000_23 [Prokaryotic dsDNA virus sp.]|tara:strand:+ start:8177 stop:8638 length:462 start_codon:yes stop_codon:yes gene_type:complete